MVLLGVGWERERERLLVKRKRNLNGEWVCTEQSSPTYDHHLSHILSFLCRRCCCCCCFFLLQQWRRWESVCMRVFVCAFMRHIVLCNLPSELVHTIPSTCWYFFLSLAHSLRFFAVGFATFSFSLHFVQTPKTCVMRIKIHTHTMCACACVWVRVQCIHFRRMHSNNGMEHCK